MDKPSSFGETQRDQLECKSSSDENGQRGSTHEDTQNGTPQRQAFEDTQDNFVACKALGRAPTFNFGLNTLFETTVEDKDALITPSEIFLKQIPTPQGWGLLASTPDAANAYPIKAIEETLSSDKESKVLVRTLLSYVARTGRLDMIDLLLQRGANPWGFEDWTSRRD